MKQRHKLYGIYILASIHLSIVVFFIFLICKTFHAIGFQTIFLVPVFISGKVSYFLFRFKRISTGDLITSSFILAFVSAYWIKVYLYSKAWIANRDSLETGIIFFLIAIGQIYYLNRPKMQEYISSSKANTVLPEKLLTITFIMLIVVFIFADVLLQSGK